MENNYGTGLFNDGVFFFTNPTNEDFTTLWNNKEYSFPAKTTCPLVIANETPENTMQIRKKFAKKLAQREFHNSKLYKDMVKKGGFIPATYNEDQILGPVIQACLTAMPKATAKVTELPRDNENNYKGSKAVRTGQDLNRVFEDYQIPEIGQLN